MVGSAAKMKRIAVYLGLFLLLAFASMGCSPALSQPFAQLKTQPITIYRLQNYEPPAAAAAANSPIPGLALPPQVQQWMSGAAQLLPPNLLPPGLIPGGTPAATTEARFHNFRILGQMVISDQKQHDEVLDLFGHESNFDAPRQTCPQLYAEFGITFGAAQSQGGVVAAPAAGAPADVLVSLSCNSVQMINYGWPYGAKTGLTSDAEKRFYEIVKKAFGG